VTDFPDGVVPPERVRIYRRNGRYRLQWWDTKEKHGRWQRVEGDLVDAITQARQIEQRLTAFKTAGLGRPRLGHEELAKLYLQDLARRMNAGEISSRTVDRYRSALQHYLVYTSQVKARFRYAAHTDRRFAQDFAAYLDGLLISPNGHPHTRKRGMRLPGYVLDTVRAMFEWAADPDRGNLLHGGFRNPFLRHYLRPKPKPDMLCAPDITVAMATDFLQACDDYQLRLFTPIVLYGLRASEPIFVFHEFIEHGWLNVRCLGELKYQTKGRRDKKLPIIEPIAARLQSPNHRRQGLVYVRRCVAEGRERPDLYGSGFADLCAAYERSSEQTDAAGRAASLQQVMKDAGALTYGHIQREFRSIATQLKWPRSATLKDFRHLFCTAMANAGVPEHERRYLMGHAPGKDAIVTYTHLDKLAEHYRQAVNREMAPVLDVLQTRCNTVTDRVA